mgnify:CR=1 FL=1
MNSSRSSIAKDILRDIRNIRAEENHAQSSSANNSGLSLMILLLALLAIILSINLSFLNASDTSTAQDILSLPLSNFNEQAN